MKLEKETKNELNNPIKIFSFNEAYVPPTFSPIKKGDVHYLSFGKDNLYPIFILSLYNNASGLHKAIINKKCRLISGFGTKEILDPRLVEWTKKNKLDQLIKFLTKDFELQNAFCYEVIWNNAGDSFDIKYVPVHSIRIGLKEHEDEADFYWYSSNWAEIKKEEHKPEYIKKFDPNDRTGRQLVYYIEPNPLSNHLYSVPNYSPAINWIELDGEISTFHLNQIKQSYTPSMVINFATGIPDPDAQQQVYREFERNFKGTSNSGRVILTYSEGKDQSPELIPINLADSDERFIMLGEHIITQITQSHEMPQMLISFVPGKLGSTDERAELMAEFQSFYTTPRQEQIEYVINSTLETIGFTEKIKLKEYTDVDKSGVLTENKPQLLQ